MGLFDLFSKKPGGDKPRNKAERELARLERLVSNKMSQNYDRQEALDLLGKMGTGPAATALFKRFNWTMDPSITDQEEKEQAAQGIVAAGVAALEPLRAYARRAESLTWPLKILRRIVQGEELTQELLAILDEFDTEYMRNAEPKVQIITALEEHATDEVREAVEPFLQDMSEPVRFAAANTVFAMGDEVSVPALVAALEEEESLRVKNRIAQGLAERQWDVDAEIREACSGALPPGFILSDGQVVAAD